MESGLDIQTQSFLCQTDGSGAVLRKAFTILVASNFCCGVALAQIQSGTGLEVENPKNIQVLVEDLSDEGKQAGLTRDLIMAKVSLRLRQNRLTPVKPIQSLKTGFLSVRIGTVGNAYHIEVSFHRTVTYSSNDQMHLIIGRAWRTGGLGTFGNDVNFIFRDLENYLDLFINAYLSANDL